MRCPGVITPRLVIAPCTVMFTVYYAIITRNYAGMQEKIPIGAAQKGSESSKSQTTAKS